MEYCDGHVFLWQINYGQLEEYFSHKLMGAAETSESNVNVWLCLDVIGTGWYYPYPSGLLHWHWGNHMIAPVPVEQAWRTG